MSDDGIQPQETVAQTAQKLTRRRTLVGAGTATAAVLGGLSLTLVSSEPVVAASIDDLDVSGDSAELSDPPSAVPVEVAAEYEGSTSVELDQLLFTLHAVVESTTYELASDAEFDVSGAFSGTMSLEGDLLDHGEVDAADLAPENGETVTLEPTFEVVVSAIESNDLKAEAVAVDSAEIVVEGGETVTLEVSGTGSVDVVA